MTKKDKGGTFAVLFSGVFQCDFLGQILLLLFVRAKNINVWILFMDSDAAENLKF